MRKNFIALACVATLLGGCASVGGVPTIDTSQITAIETQVQKDAAAICGFVPTIGTIAAIVATFAGGGPIVGIATQVATSICNAVVPKVSARRKLGTPSVNGVPIQGYFIR